MATHIRPVEALVGVSVIKCEYVVSSFIWPFSHCSSLVLILRAVKADSQKEFGSQKETLRKVEVQHYWWRRVDFRSLTSLMEPFASTRLKWSESRLLTGQR